MKKVLFVATVTRHINAFHIPYLKWFKEQGYEVHVASNGNEKIEYCDKHFNLPFERFPLKVNNIKTYKELKKIIDDNNYEIIHCHTPVGGVLARLAARKARKKGTRVIYTAHGFHFFKGAPLLNWLIYYPVEKICAKWTDCLITINEEDYELAKNKFKIKDIYKVNGTGVDTKKFEKQMTEKDKSALRKELKVKDNDFVIVCIGELNKNKNQIMQINVMKEIVKKHNNVKLLLIGKGVLKEYYEQKIKELNLQNNVFLLGYREDVSSILNVADCLVSTSIREGLGLNIIEGMSAGIPVMGTNNRGHRELIINNNNGYLVDINNEKDLADAIEKVINKKNIDYIIRNSRETAKKYDIEVVKEQLEKIYSLMEKKNINVI